MSDVHPDTGLTVIHWICSCGRANYHKEKEAGKCKECGRKYDGKSRSQKIQNGTP